MCTQLTLYTGADFRLHCVAASVFSQVQNSQWNLLRVGVWGAAVLRPYKIEGVSRAIRTMASRLRSTSASVVAQEETLIRIAVLPRQTVAPHQQVPSS